MSHLAAIILGHMKPLPIARRLSLVANWLLLGPTRTTPGIQVQPTLDSDHCPFIALGMDIATITQPVLIYHVRPV